MNNTSMKTIRPLGNWLLVEPLDLDEPQQGIIIKPDSVRRKSDDCRVIALGTGRPLKDGSRTLADFNGLQAGDKVVILPYFCQPVEHEGRKCVLVNASDVNLKIEEPAASEPPQAPSLSKATAH